uniref:AMP-dependent synthetase/ligase domain-containing protein n=1 Tax=Glossina brevipalpis TaxID=37001 RepID=A0A1A9WFD4_9MUSC
MISTQTTYNSEKKIWHGLQKPLDYGPNSSLGSAILESLMKDPNHITQICHPSGKTYTNSEIANLTIRVAQYFQKLQFKLGDIVGICAVNSDFIAPLIFGAWTIGLIVNTMDTSFDVDGLRHAFVMTKPKIMFCDGTIYHKIKELFEECNLTKRIYTMKDHIEGVPNINEFLKGTGEEQQFKVPSLPNGSNEVAVILFSSGTTGLPKGVCLSHANLLNRTILYSYIPKLLFITGYGMSETSGACTYGEMKAEFDVGEVAANMELKVVDDDNVPLGCGKLGELHLRSSLPWHGYYKDPKATAAICDSERWIHSGDIGYVDENGRYRVKKFLDKSVDYMLSRLANSEEERNLLAKEKDSVITNISECIESHLSKLDEYDSELFSIPGYVLLPSDDSKLKVCTEEDEEKQNQYVQQLKQEFLENSLMLASIKLENEKYDALENLFQDEMAIEDELKEMLNNYDNQISTKIFNIIKSLVAKITNEAPNF